MILKNISKITLEMMKSFWNSSTTIMWGFIPLLILTSYKIELIGISETTLLTLRILLIRTWKYFWLAFFISNFWSGIKSETQSD